MSARARLQVALVTLTVLLMAGLASATPCTGPTLAAVIAEGNCTIGDKTFDFSNNYSGSFYDSATNTQTNITPDQITFTPINSNTAPGFKLGGFPLANGSPGNYQDAYFIDYFTVVAPDGRLITLAPAGIQTPVFTGGAAGYNYASVSNAYSWNTAYNYYGSYQAYGAQGGPYSQTLYTYAQLYDYSWDAGSAGFVSALFLFDQSTVNTPEPASLALLGSGLLLAGGLVRRKLNAKL